jgi:ABC-type multidrug transport system ATPase subunit
VALPPAIVEEPATVANYDVDATVLAGASRHSRGQETSVGSARSSASVAPATSTPNVVQRDLSHGVVIGKSADADFFLADVLVSRRHARLMRQDTGLILEDLGSTNGTFVNGQVIAMAPVFEGDVITIGNTDLTIRSGELDYFRTEQDTSGGLSVYNLGFTIKGGKALLREINVRSAPGTLTAVIGPSGAGKSTFSKMIAGLTEPTTGQVVFDSFDVHKNFDLVRSRIGLVPQDDVLHTSLKLEKALMYAAKLRLNTGNDDLARKAQVDKVITQLELDNHRGTRIDRLSGGQRKRASVALELLTEPSLLILDEPTSGLDPALDRQVMQTLRGLATGGRAVLVVTHSVAFLDVCDDVLILAPGGMPAYCGPSDGIAAFFGTGDWADIFAGLTADPQASFRKFVDATGNPSPPASEKLSEHEGVAGRVSPRWMQQFTTLCARQMSLIFSDWGYLAFLFALPIIVGLLVLVVPGQAGLGMAARATPAEPAQLIAMLVIGASFMGASISIRDLVGERPIFLRERAVGLPISAYLSSKLLVFGVFSWVMAGILTLVTFAVKPAPIEFVVIPIPQLELFLALGLTANTSMILGLLLSSLVRSSEQAMPLLIIVLMAQLVLNGGLLPLAGRPFVYEMSALIVAKWGFAMAASGVDLQNISPPLEEDLFWDHTLGMWVLAASCIIGFGLIFSAMTRMRLEAKYQR